MVAEMETPLAQLVTILGNVWQIFDKLPLKGLWHRLPAVDGGWQSVDLRRAVEEKNNFREAARRMTPAFGHLWRAFDNLKLDHLRTFDDL